MPHTAGKRGSLHERLETLRTLRDEIRVQIHLAGRDLRDEWNALDERLTHPERRICEYGRAAEIVADRLISDVRAFRDALADRLRSPRT